MLLPFFQVLMQAMKNGFCLDVIEGCRLMPAPFTFGG